MADYLSPGVYVEEYDNVPKKIEGVGTSTAGFVGLAERGPAAGAPELVTNFADFRWKFGGYLPESTYGSYRYLAYAVEQFFLNGGSRCYVSRVLLPGAGRANAVFRGLEITAKSEGSWGNRITFVVQPSREKERHLDVQVRYEEQCEEYNEVNLDAESVDYIVSRLANSALVTMQVESSEGYVSPVTPIFEEERREIALNGGSDGKVENMNASIFIGEDKGLGLRTGIQSFLENTVVSVMAVPGIIMPEVLKALIAHCEKLGSRFAVLDMPKKLSDIRKMKEYREQFDSTYAAMYHPWIQNFDRSAKRSDFFPPSGAVAGIYGRTDIARGVHKAPANETVSCTGLSINFTKAEQDILNPEGVNLIRALPGQGIRIWGARTAGSNSTFKYINVRRLFIYIEESIKANTNWVVFEQNDFTLWSRVTISVEGFLNQVWRNGMLAGSSPEESYFVEIGPTTMSQDDIQNGRLICKIGIAPSRPAEFIIFRITQHTAESGN